MKLHRPYCPFILFGVFVLAITAQGQIGLWDSLRTETDYFRALDAADSTTFLWAFSHPFALLLSDAESDSFKDLPSIDARKATIRRFWRETNPNPILSSNDWIEIFLGRLQTVNRRFSISKPPYFDDRGAYWIRYGQPTNFYRDIGGQKTLTFFKNSDVLRYVSSLAQGTAPLVYYNSYPNESWAYRDINRDFVVHFVRVGEMFREVKSLSSAFVTSMSKNVAWYWGEMIKSRAHLSPSLSRAANSLLNLENDILGAAYSGRQFSSGESGRRLPHQIIRQTMQSYERDEEEGRYDPPAFVAYPERAVNRLRFTQHVAQFRGSGDSTRISVTGYLPLEEILSASTLPVSPDSIGLVWQGLFRDDAFEPVARNGQAQRIQADAVLTKYAVCQLAFQAQPQFGDLTVQIQERTSGQIGFSKDTLRIRDFSGDALMMSDIQFLTEPVDSGLSTPGDDALAAYPFPDLRHSVPLVCYFEVYNLAAAMSSTVCDITLKVTTDRRRRGILKRFFSLFSAGSDAAVSLTHRRPFSGNVLKESMTLDFTSLQPGRYMLGISVTDPGRPLIRASSKRTFVVTEDR